MEINKELIAETAINILNRGGIGSLTMRSLAMELGIKAASLYWHIKSKGELYDIVAEKISAGMKPACSMKNAKNYLTETAKLYREKLLRVRDSVEIFMQSAPVTQERLELIKNCMICLLHMGVSEKNCMIAANMFNNYILSFVADEMRWNMLSRERGDSKPEAQEANPFISVLGQELELMSGEEQFTRGLDVLFAGFKILK
ncbi:MAG: TetR/AcrR family transcriptional regulator C-terminal domain-containing protein [Spirochaetaceae bacterium]|jgi:AcrR family transcriptional regulator|nr:TetR/AcrR family transcriptional regulator C-terminal domain-containing protein [Spirochaetaceae bacterium]